MNFKLPFKRVAQFLNEIPCFWSPFSWLVSSTSYNRINVASQLQKMEILLNNPGYHHIVQKLCLMLDLKTLNNCSLVNKSWNWILNNPHIWLKLCTQRNLFEQNSQDWIEMMNLRPMNIEIQKSLVRVFKRRLFILTVEEKLDCLNQLSESYKIQLKTILVQTGRERSDPEIRKLFGPILSEHKRNWQQFEKKNHSEIWFVKINQRISQFVKNLELPLVLAILSQEPKLTKFLLQAYKNDKLSVGSQNLIKTLSKSCQEYCKIRGKDKSINAQDKHDKYLKGFLEVAKIFANLPNSDPNTPDTNQNSPLHRAAQKGFVEVVKILAPICEEDPNSYLNNFHYTPLLLAVWKGHIQVVKNLLPFCNNPNLRNHHLDWTPLEAAENYGHAKIANFISESCEQNFRRVLKRFLEFENQNLQQTPPNKKQRRVTFNNVTEIFEF